MNIKEQYPNYQGFFNKSLVAVKTKRYKNGWCKIESKSKKEFNDASFKANAYNFYDSYSYDTGAGVIKDSLGKYVENAIKESKSQVKFSSKLKKEMLKFVAWFNREYQLDYKVQIGLFKDSLYALGNEIFVIYDGYLVGIVRYTKHNDIEEWYITDFFGKTPLSKRTEKHFNSSTKLNPFKDLKLELENKLLYIIDKTNQLNLKD